jgi:uncharacterized membrane protein YfhO
VAFVEEPVTLPGDARGEVSITGEIPTHIALRARMDTAGLVVLADNFDSGWRAFRGDDELPILRVNHALRGMVVPAGDSRIDLRYWPSGFTWGFRLAGLAVLILLVWLAAIVSARARSRPAGS